MAEEPKTRPEKDDRWGVGQMADGSIPSFTPEQAAALRGERDAEEEAFDEGEDEEDFDDIDDPLPNEGD